VGTHVDKLGIPLDTQRTQLVHLRGVKGLRSQRRHRDEYVAPGNLVLGHFQEEGTTLFLLLPEEGSDPGVGMAHGPRRSWSQRNENHSWLMFLLERKERLLV